MKAVKCEFKMDPTTHRRVVRYAERNGLRRSRAYALAFEFGAAELENQVVSINRPETLTVKEEKLCPSP
jgi:hypothetical protein